MKTKQMSIWLLLGVLLTCCNKHLQSESPELSLAQKKTILSQIKSDPLFLRYVGDIKLTYEEVALKKIDFSHFDSLAFELASETKNHAEAMKAAGVVLTAEYVSALNDMHIAFKQLLTKYPIIFRQLTVEFRKLIEDEVRIHFEKNIQPFLKDVYGKENKQNIKT
jgi:hypothetical protein